MKAADPRVDRALVLRSSGLEVKQIAAKMAVSRSTVYRWVNPDYAERSRRLSNAAKKRRTGTCVDCGTTTGAAKYGGTSPRCTTCYHVASRTADYDRIVELRKQGMTQAQIAAEVGCLQPNVAVVLAKNGMSVGKGCGPKRGAKLVAS